jgi:hypothetical protein
VTTAHLAASPEPDEPRSTGSGPGWHGISDPPSFGLYRKMLDSPHVRPPRREAISWALDELERRMGANWLERYWKKASHVPPEVNLGSAHVSALAKLLEFTLRFAVLDGLPGAGKVQKEMKNDVRDERRHHCALQLEVGALAARAGYTAAFEEPVQPARPPSDVVLRRGDEMTRTETFAIMPDQSMREADAFWHHISRSIMLIRLAHDTPISGTITGPMADEDAAHLLRLLEAAASKAAATGDEQPVALSQAQLRVQPPGSRGDGLQFSAPQTDRWPRIAGKLRGKAEQAQASGGGWLRADILEGTWAFTDWGRSGLRAKLDQIAPYIKTLLAPYASINGAILSNSDGLAYGQVIGESARTAAACYALRRTLPGARARETIIIATTDTGRRQARSWVDIYGPEDSWLDWALSKYQLPPWDEIRP